MAISKRTLLLTACICLNFAVSLWAVTYRVASDGSAQFKTIQEAINKAAPGDIVQIMDVAQYKEQVTIDSTKNGLTLTSVAPTALNKPKIVWQDIVNVHPNSYAESRVDSLINFDRNGALRILGAKDVTINGIAVDGGGPYVFGYPSIWNNLSDLLHGNAALTIWVSGNAHIINCDLSNAYFGINFKDRNQGGIFANANPADLQPQNIVPMSGFGKTGNHVIEYSRIHNNSYGMFFESGWDLGSTIRYNLFFENHHQSTAFAQKVKKLTPQEGNNQPGGAMMFKDVAYSPLSIYNNTFWHNFLIFIGSWRAGLQHLIFNNIYAKPFVYWGADQTFGSDAYMEITTFLGNRMNNCVYSCQSQAPATGYVPIMNQLQVPQGAGGAQPVQGALLSTATANAAFPAAANIRWIEMDSTRFASMDPATVNFLQPLWDDTLITQYIKNAGWQKAGIKNMDGGWADLGAIASDGARPTDLASIRPNDPVTITNNTATVKFTISERVGKLQSPTMKLFRWVGNLPLVTATSWSGVAANIITANNITDITLPAAPALRVGVNSYKVTVPPQTTDYAFFEGIVEGKDVNGKSYTTSTGFLPYRKLDYKFIVEVWNSALTKKIDTVTVGDTVILKITPQKKDGSSFTNTINPVDVSLVPDATLWNTSLNPMQKLTYPAGITGATNRTVMFTKVPGGGVEEISATGTWSASATDTNKLVFQGSTDVVVLAGPPDSVIFQDPASKRFQTPPPTLNPGQPYPGYVYVYDKWHNIVSKPASVTLTSLTPNLANFVGGAPNLVITTDNTGKGSFQVTASNNAQENNMVSLLALLNPNNKTDTAYMKVGKRAERLFIFYGDTAGYNPAAQLRGQVGDKLLVTVIATKSDNPSKDSIVATRTDTFTVAGVPGSLQFYNSPTATTPASSFVLVNGRASVWVSSGDTVNNGSLSLTSYSISSGNPRSQIFFTRPAVSIDSAFYYSRTGWGTVDSVDIFCKNKLSMIPDSITLFWPGADSGKRVIAGSGTEMKLASDSIHITIVLSAPFAREITGSTVPTTAKQGILYTRPNINAPEASSQFVIKDRVGPLVMAAQVVERIPPGPGTDTMFVSFSENVQAASLTGDALILIKNGAESKLTIQSASPIAGNRYKLVVTGASFPQSGDSLRIVPAGPIIDALGNGAHPKNRPMVITIKTVPAGIVSGYYVDNDANKRADGIVDTVYIAFNKKVDLNDLSVSLDWGGTIRADSLSASSMKFVTGDSVIAISVLGKFKNMPADNVKTSGTITASVAYGSAAGEPPKTGTISDNAAAVVVDSAVFRPASLPVNGTTATFIDSLFVTFSEKIKNIGGQRQPFTLKQANGTAYTFRLKEVAYSDANLSIIRTAGDKFTYMFLVDSIIGIQNPISGDSLWIGRGADGSGSGVTDAAGNVQTHFDNNRKVPLIVFRTPFNPNVKPQIVKNPFTPPDSIVLKFKVTIPRLSVFSNIKLSASGKIFDIFGNCVFVWPERSVQMSSGHSSEQGLSLGWNGQNTNSRYVGSGVYLAIVTFVQDNGKEKTSFTDQKIKIGVRR